MQTILLDLLEIVVIGISILIGRYVIPILKTNLSAQELAIASTWATTFVRYAEEVITGEKKGSERFEKVVGMLKDKMQNLRVNISDSDVTALIEEAVKTMNDEAQKCSSGSSN